MQMLPCKENAISGSFRCEAQIVILDDSSCWHKLSCQAALDEMPDMVDERLMMSGTDPTEMDFQLVKPGLEIPSRFKHFAVTSPPTCRLEIF